MKRCAMLPRSLFQAKEMLRQHPRDHHLRESPLAFAMTSRLASVPGERIADTNMKRQTKEKAEVRKVSPGPSQEAMTDLCLQDLGIRCVSFGRQVSVNEGNDCAFQHPPKPAAASTKDDKRGKSQKKKKKNKKKGDRSRSSSRGSNSSRGSHRLPLAQLQFA